MSKIFLNIPDDIEEIIKSFEPESFNKVFRMISHTGPFKPTDFYPTFADSKQKERVEKARLKGGPANVVVSMKTSEYGVSLSINKALLKHKFKSHRDEYPVIASGKTDSNKGVAHLDKEEHVSYYLFNYLDETMNPYTDFEKEECVHNE